MSERIVVQLTAESQVAILQRLLKGLPVRKSFVCAIDRPRDSYKATSRISDAGVAPPRRKASSGAGKGNYRVSGHRLEPKHPFNCKYCKKAGLGKLKTREFCYNNGLCKGRYETAQKKRSEVK